MLAVIVVLAIIALIAVPMILNIIENARKGAAIASARSYIKAVETYIVSSELDKNKIELISKNKYNVTTTTTIDDKTYQAINNLVEIKGSLPIGNEDYIKIDENNQVEEVLLTINGYVILMRYGEVINISKGSIISVESITLDKESENLEIGKTLQLNVTIAPDNATNKIVTWTSSNKNIASVDNNGLVTGLKVGNTIITAKASNGKTATANIIVSSISVKENVDTNIEHGTNKDIISTYFDVTGDLSNITCKVGNVEVSSTDDIAEKVGINNTYKVTCSTATGSASIDLKVANKLYLYKDGNEFTNITGGWNYVKESSANRGSYQTTNEIDLDKYSKINYVMNNTLISGESYHFHLYLINDDTNWLNKNYSLTDISGMKKTFLSGKTNCAGTCSNSGDKTGAYLKMYFTYSSYVTADIRLNELYLEK